MIGVLIFEWSGTAETSSLLLLDRLSLSTLLVWLRDTKIALVVHLLYALNDPECQLQLGEEQRTTEFESGSKPRPALDIRKEMNLDGARRNTTKQELADTSLLWGA
ncbi:hypothetical protein FRC12_006311 [Ceratobasidium sp. 428]|nr:hypothetical protein FRC12_006311 [Ceratobasidium sp. 428]